MAKSTKTSTSTVTQATTQTTAHAVNIGCPSVVVKICPSNDIPNKTTTQAVKVGLFGSDSKGDYKDITEKAKEPPPTKTSTVTQTTTQTTTNAVNIGCPSVVVKICPSDDIPNKTTTQAVKVGLFGSDSKGDYKDITEKTKEPPAWLKSVHIWSTDVQDGGLINAITFTIVDEKCFRCTLGPWGSMLPDHHGTLIDLEKTGGYMTELSGYTDGENITSLTIVTNENNKKETYGPFGKPNPEDSGDTKFSIPLEKGAIVAFFGRSDGNCLKAIGAYVVGLKP